HQPRVGGKCEFGELEDEKCCRQYCCWQRPPLPPWIPPSPSSNTSTAHGLPLMACLKTWSTPSRKLVMATCGSAREKAWPDSMAGNSQFLIGEMCQDSKTVPSWPYWKTTNSRSCGWALILAALLATVQVSFVPSAQATDFPTIM